MYSPSLILTLTLTALTFSLANPLTTRSGPGVYICTGPDWAGICEWLDASDYACHNYIMDPTASFGPDHGLECTVFAGLNCDYTGGLRGGLHYPGYGDARDNMAQSGFGGGASFQCEYGTL